MGTWLVHILQFIKPLRCIMWVGGWSEFLLHGRWRNMISIFFWCSGCISLLENELISKVTLGVPSQSWQADHILLSSPWPICCIPTHRLGYVTLHHTLFWVIEPSVLHILTSISARVLEWVFFAFPHSLNPCDMTCPAGVERKCVDCRFHSFAEYCKLVWVPWFCCFK